jgi:metallo-beta-lactamase class B
MIKSLLLILFSVTILSGYAQKNNLFKSKVVYKSDDLLVTQISRNSYVHTSFLKTQDFGKVPCNGLIVTDSNEAIVFDTPTNDTNAAVLIQWIKETIHCKINAIIPTHFHDDCLAGLKAFDEQNIPSYAYFKTIELAKQNNFSVPKNSFKDSLILAVGSKHIIAKFFGEGHTKDNIVGYFPGEHIMFGGCLIKEIDASKGYLGDANIASWSATAEKVKMEYPNYTINLFKAN